MAVASSSVLVVVTKVVGIDEAETDVITDSEDIVGATSVAVSSVSEDGITVLGSLTLEVEDA